MNRIKQLRKEHGLKQRELAEEFNRYILQNKLKVKPINFSVVSKWETGKSAPTKATYKGVILTATRDVHNFSTLH